jgi:putative spermidine/putrescine transport system ATP-binding protein
VTQARSAHASDHVRESGHTLHVDRLSYSYGSSLAIDDVSLNIKPGELVALLGPSGCGKTTLLRAIAGFLTPRRGNILIDGERLNDVPVRSRGIGVMFQNYALFPHMNVEQNIAYGLDAQRARGASLRQRVHAMLRLVQLEALKTRFPRELSGGQQQRVALARALATEPRILLLDEPFAALDKNLRLDMQIEIRRLQQQIGITTILVTHDQDEAMSMADRIAVMCDGRVEQFAPPTEVYDRPASLFVNHFVGSVNLVDATIFRRDDGALAIEIPGSGAIYIAAANRFAPDAVVTLSVRPENLHRLATSEPKGLEGEITLVMPLGGVCLLEVRLPGGQLLKLTELRKTGARLPLVGDRVNLALVSDEAASLFPRTTSQIPHLP